MDDVAIKIEGIGKRYTVGKQVDKSMRGALGNILKSASSKGEDFWALKDISFEVKKGEVIGIIGKNGAGKSTLLKILSQITKPTEGRIEMHGRVASLLEVGTGFHPELTGRENIYLNGTILGMTRKEVKSKFDEIVEFSGVGKFMDTPVKHYSSGMYVRLAFAVAAHLEPEILVIDEVLAVGDSEFQKKCLGKMRDVANHGRTVLFVSHNMSAVTSLCEKCVYISGGKVKSFGESNQIVSEYLSQANDSNSAMKWEGEDRPGDDKVVLHSARLIGEDNEPVNFAEIQKKVGVEMVFEVLKEGRMLIPNIHVFTSMQEHAFASSANNPENIQKKGIHKTVAWIPADLLNDGNYTITLAISSMKPYVEVHCYVPHALFVNAVEDISFRGNDYTQKIPGVVRPKLTWDTVQI